MTLHGIDVSRWNGIAGLSSQDFQIARATYGTVPDPKYRAHTANAKANGVVAGAYHFGVSGSVVAQVDAFVAAIRPTGVRLVALDLEYNGSNTMTNDHAAQFIAQMQAKSYLIGLYHSRSGHPRLGQNWDWIADWNATTFPPGSEMWQYQGNPIDRNRFDGTLVDLKRLAGISTPSTQRVHIAPQPGTKGYPHFRYFNTFDVAGHAIDGTNVARTGGFTASCSQPQRFLWAGHSAQMLVRLTSGSRAGTWVRAAWMED